MTSSDVDAQAECMRARDVVVGQTYVVLIPHRISQGRDPDREQPGTPASAWWWMTGTRFRLTVTEVDSTSSPAMVAGRPITESPSIEVALTDEQVTALTALGLPSGDYRVRGRLLDDHDRPVGLPEPLRVPVHWLRPAEGIDDHTHRELDRNPPWG
ncbi:hypothetical protein ACQP1O_18485 [Nocardia sp. CA-151230]|uniref:hypothetical protein n=1 Tax=Nocardia sp. CA-151230 TaxID=3239982 RepID=UPI003D8EB042